MTSYVVVATGSSHQVFSYQRHAEFLDSVQGSLPRAPHLAAIAWKGQTKSIAQEINQGVEVDEANQAYWRDVAKYILQLG
jgi:hypothetical protein